MNFVFLDSVCQGLWFSALAVSPVFVVMWITSKWQKKASPVALKRFFQTHLLLLLGFFVTGFFLPQSLDSQLMRLCTPDSDFSTLISRSLAGLWLVGLGLLLVIDAVRLIRGWRGLQPLAPLRDPKVETLLCDLASKFALERTPPILLSPSEWGIFVWGLWKTRLVISDQIVKTCDDQGLTHLLAHELVHVREHDGFWMSLELFSRRLLFFHPLAFLVGRIYAELTEKAADAQAVQLAELCQSGYLQTLLGLAESRTQPLSVPLRLHASQGYRELKSRIESLHQPPNPERESFAKGWIFALSLVAVLISLTQMESTYAALVKSAQQGLMCAQVQKEKTLEKWLPKAKLQIQCDNENQKEGSR